MRYLNKFIKKDLKDKMVILSGPRQAGKTTLAKTLMDHKSVYLNWDIKKDQRIIRAKAWPKNSSLIILDELHKMPMWKNFLKGVVDQYGNKPPLLITGSARLDTFRKQGDALTGRYYHYRLHPFDLSEASSFSPKLKSSKILDRLLDTGGFPEAYSKPGNAERLKNNRLTLVLQEDLKDVSGTNSIRKIELLIELLKERVGSTISYSNLANDLGVSGPTVKAWIELLERLYIIFIVYPYYKGIARSIRKEPKCYFYDCSASFEDIKGARLENLVACSLLKYCHFMEDTKGVKQQLYFFRDREKREVDFLVTENRKVKWCIEVKSKNRDVHKALYYLDQRLKPSNSFQLVKEWNENLDFDGIGITPLAPWLNEHLLLF